MRFPSTSRAAPPHIFIAAALALIFSLFGGAFPAIAGDTNKTVRLLLPWGHQFGFAGYVAALERGLYAKEGLQVEIITGSPSTQLIDDVVSGAVQFGISNSNLIVHRLSEGKPVVALAPIFQKSPNILLARKDSGINTPHDLIGKRVMLAEGMVASESLATLSNEGLRIEDVKRLSPSWQIADLINGQVDAIAAHITDQPYRMTRAGVDVSIIRPQNYGVDFYGQTLFTSEKLLHDDPELVAAFRRASLAGWDYALNNPEEIIELLLTSYRTAEQGYDREFLLQEAQHIRNLIMAELVTLGHSNPGRWQFIAKTYESLGFIPPDWSLDGFLYDPTQPHSHWDHWLIRAALGFAPLICGALFVTSLVNRRLATEVQERKTAEAKLVEQQEKLEDLVASRTLQLNLQNEQLSQEVKERQHFEQELRQRKELLEKILDTIPVMICTVNPVGRMTFANKEFLRVFEMTLEQIQNHPDMFSVWYPDPEYRASVLEFIQKAEGKFAEFSTCNASGKKIPTSFANVLLQDGTSIGIGLDITERKQTESERELLLKAIEQTAEIIMVTDPNGIIEYVNPAFEKATGYSREEILGKTPDLLRSGEESDDYYRAMWADLANGKTWRGRFANKRKDGSLYTEDACISPVINDQGHITNYVATKHDITHQLAIEQQFLQAQKMESVGQLAGGVAHDFNNMLSLIIGRAELGMRKLQASDASYKTLHEIQNAAQRSAKLTQQLLAFARRQAIAPQVLDLNDCVESTLQMLKSLIGENIELLWLPGAPLWPVKIDPAQFDQVLTNLTVNARDAIADIGRITLESSKATFDQAYCDQHTGFIPGEFTKLAISDNGTGIDTETRKRIFEPFYTTKGPGEGTGLGLATVYGIVKQNNGFINVYSEPGQGTTFTLYFPRIHGQVEEIGVKKPAVVQEGQGQTILLVEDDKSLLRLSEELLNELGYRVFAAESPAEAIRIATSGQQTFDLLITDVIMPGMNGKELADSLLRHRPELKVLFTSGYTANVIARQSVLEEGGNFLQKPFSLNDLAEKLYEILG